MACGVVYKGKEGSGGGGTVTEGGDGGAEVIISVTEGDGMDEIMGDNGGAPPRSRCW